MSKTIAKLRARVRNKQNIFYGGIPTDFRIGFEIECIADSGTRLYLYVSKEIFEKLREGMKLELTISEIQK